MLASRSTERLHGVVDVFSLWEDLKECAERARTAENKAEASLTAGTLVLIGYVAFVA